MDQQFQLKVKLFGAFRSWVPDGEVSLSVSAASSMVSVKVAIENELKRLTGRDPALLLSKSAIASETEILQEQDQVSAGMVLAVLPPICGG